MAEPTPFNLRPPSPVHQAILLSVPEPLLGTDSEPHARKATRHPAPRDSFGSNKPSTALLAHRRRLQNAPRARSHDPYPPPQQQPATPVHRRVRSMDAARDERKRQRSLVKVTSSLNQDRRFVALEREVILSKIEYINNSRTQQYTLHRRDQAREVVQPCLTRTRKRVPITPNKAIHVTQHTLPPYSTTVAPATKKPSTIGKYMPKPRPKWNNTPFKPAPGIMSLWEAPLPVQKDSSQRSPAPPAAPVKAKPPSTNAVVRSRIKLAERNDPPAAPTAHAAPPPLPPKAKPPVAPIVPLRRPIPITPSHPHQPKLRSLEKPSANVDTNWATPAPPQHAADIARPPPRPSVTAPPRPSTSSISSASELARISNVSLATSTSSSGSSPFNMRRRLPIFIPRLRLPRQPALPPLDLIPSPVSSSTASSCSPLATGETYSRGDSSEGERLHTKFDVDESGTDIVFPKISLPGYSSSPSPPAVHKHAAGVQVRRRPVATSTPQPMTASPAQPRKPIAPILAFQHARVPRPSELGKGVTVVRRPLDDVRTDAAPLAKDRLMDRESLSAGDHHGVPQPPAEARRLGVNPSPSKQPPRMGVMHRLDSLQNLRENTGMDYRNPAAQYYRTPERNHESTAIWVERTKAEPQYNFSAAGGKKPNVIDQEKRVLRPVGTNAMGYKIEAFHTGLQRRPVLSTPAAPSKGYPKQRLPSVKIPPRLPSSSFSPSAVHLDGFDRRDNRLL